MPDYVLLNNTHYIVDFIVIPGEPESVKCILFDMKSLWLEQLPITTLVKRENERNPICAYNQTLVKNTLLAEQVAHYALHTKATNNAGETFQTLSIKYYIAETPITFEFSLKPGTVEELAECIIKPLWGMVMLLDAKNRALQERLVQKDAEIEQYRAEGAELKRTTVITETFDKQLFDERFPLQRPADYGLDVQRLLDGSKQRKDLTKSLNLLAISDEHGAGSVARREPRLSPYKKSGTKRPAKKWTHQRLDGLIYPSARLPKLPANPLNRAVTMAARFGMEEKDEVPSSGN